MLKHGLMVTVCGISEENREKAADGRRGRRQIRQRRRDYIFVPFVGYDEGDNYGEKDLLAS